MCQAANGETVNQEGFSFAYKRRSKNVDFKLEPLDILYITLHNSNNTGLIKDFTTCEL